MEKALPELILPFVGIKSQNQELEVFRNGTIQVSCAYCFLSSSRYWLGYLCDIITAVFFLLMILTMWLKGPGCPCRYATDYNRFCE